MSIIYFSILLNFPVGINKINEIFPILLKYIVWIAIIYLSIIQRVKHITFTPLNGADKYCIFESTSFLPVRLLLKLLLSFSFILWIIIPNTGNFIYVILCEITQSGVAIFVCFHDWTWSKLWSGCSFCGGVTGHSRDRW